MLGDQTLVFILNQSPPMGVLLLIVLFLQEDKCEIEVF